MSASASSRGPTPPPTSPRHGSPQPQNLPAGELTEALKNTGMSAPYNPLLQAVEATGRTRGSSATPILQSARLSLASGIKTSSMTEGNNYLAQPYGYSHYPTVGHSQQGPCSQTYGNQPRQSQQPPLSSNQRYLRGSLSSRSPSSNPRKISSMRSTIEQHNINLQQQLYAMSQRIGQQVGIPSHAVSSFREELRNISDNYQRRSVTFLAEFEKLTTEHAEFVKQADEKQRLIEKVTTERDRAKTQRDQLKTQMTDMQRQLADQMKALETSHARTVEDLQRELSMKEEQVEGKRSLWISTSSARRAREPFSTPSGERAVSSKSGPQPTNLMKQFETLKLASDAPEASLLGSGGLTFCSQTGTKSSGDKIENMALVPFKPEERVAAEFSEKFEKTYTLAERWIRTHTNIVPDPSSSSDMSVTYDSDLYKCILRTCYNTLEAAQVHVASLLKDALGRPMLFLRVLIDYIRDQIWTARAFMGLDDVCGKRLDNIEKSLAAKEGLTPEKRAKLIDAQTQVITYILENDRYTAFRSAQLGKHSAALRKLLGPLLLKDGSRESAARDLSQLVVFAFDLSAEMLLANRTFVVRFPETGTRFLNTSMICRDPSIKESSLNLHIRHARVRLTIRPAITMRNDLYRTIQVHSVQFAHVLVMN